MKKSTFWSDFELQNCSNRFDDENWFKLNSVTENQKMMIKNSFFSKNWDFLSLICCFFWHIWHSCSFIWHSHSFICCSWCSVCLSCFFILYCMIFNSLKKYEQIEIKSQMWLLKISCQIWSLAFFFLKFSQIWLSWLISHFLFRKLFARFSLICCLVSDWSSAKLILMSVNWSHDFLAAHDESSLKRSAVESSENLLSAV